LLTFAGNGRQFLVVVLLAGLLPPALKDGGHCRWLGKEKKALNWSVGR